MTRTPTPVRELIRRGPTTWRPAERTAALRCGWHGHRWASVPELSGMLVIQCDRCRELVSARFVDTEHVQNNPRTGTARSSVTGPVTTGPHAVTGVGALLAGDDQALEHAREHLTSRPGDGVDSLLALAASIAIAAQQMGGPDPVILLQRLALTADLALLGAPAPQTTPGAPQAPPSAPGAPQRRWWDLRRPGGSRG